MTTETKKPVTTPTWDKKEKDAIAEYGCELLVENASQEDLRKTMGKSQESETSQTSKTSVLLQ